ncbi:hypothetical protein V6N12_013564 [Hibiscus sabdariffa]|uniref:Uncharacterized protein n=1 Tax=Hibiscus sabdariffa TaxID=183260 RepID=A0ABR2C9R1_9ROSI
MHVHSSNVVLGYNSGSHQVFVGSSIPPTQMAHAQVHSILVFSPTPASFMTRPFAATNTAPAPTGEVFPLPHSDLGVSNGSSQVMPNSVVELGQVSPARMSPTTDATRTCLILHSQVPALVCDGESPSQARSPADRDHCLHHSGLEIHGFSELTSSTDSFRAIGYSDKEVDPHSGSLVENLHPMVCVDMCCSEVLASVQEQLGKEILEKQRKAG